MGYTWRRWSGCWPARGLRSGEAVKFDRGDVDLNRGVIFIRKTKFRKDRLVPVHPTTWALFVGTPANVTRVSHARGARPSFSALGVAVCRRAACKPTSLRLASSPILTRASLCDRTICGIGSQWTRLRLWHQQRADVQALLPLLATYLGHANYSDTAYYLTGSSDLLAIAAERAFLDGGAA